MKWFSRVLSIALVICMLALVPAYAQGESNLKKITPSAESAFFDLVFSDIVHMYQYDVDETDIYSRLLANMINEDPALLDAFLKALFDSFDDYSEYYTAEEFEDFVNRVEGITGGIGVYIEKGTSYVHVTGTLPGTPAEIAGIHAGDDIVEVDGENVEGRSLDYVSYKLRGEIGSKVIVTVQRNNERLTFEIVRGEIASKTVTYGLLSDDVAYIGIHTFGSATAKEVDEALSYIDNLGVKKIVIDLRDNGGGYVDAAIEIARKFVPAGTIIYHYTKANRVMMDYKSYLKETKYEIATLVNEHTASASEILASALQESGASKLVGVKTFGKAVTQSAFPLYAGRYCKLTTGEYFTRNGNKINRVGLKPDVSVSNKTAKLRNTDVEKLVYCSAYSPNEVNDGVSGFKMRLKLMGYNIDEVNDVYDDTFAAVISSYQAKNEIAVTGVLDILTQIHITNTSDDYEVLIDKQLAKACELLGSSYDGLNEI